MRTETKYRRWLKRWLAGFPGMPAPTWDEDVKQAYLEGYKKGYKSGRRSIIKELN